MAAPLVNAFNFGKNGMLCTYCRLACIHHQQKRLIQNKKEMLKPYTVSASGNINRNSKPFPDTWRMDPDVEKECMNDPLRYPKHHPGLTGLKTVHLPKLLAENALAMLMEHSLIGDTNFLKKVKHLNQVFLRRQPPMEITATTERLNEIASELFDKEFTKLNVNPDELTEEQKSAMMMRVTDKARHIYKKTTHNYLKVQYKSDMGLVYMAARLAANYSVLLQIFTQLRKLDNNFKPYALLNVGSGVGSSIWAADTIWDMDIFEYYCVDTSSHMNDLARLLVSKDGQDPLKLSIPGVAFRQFIPSDKDENNRFPLVVSAYLLMEHNQRDRYELVRSLWNLTGDYLVLVEHGTLAGYKLIMEARDIILKDIPSKGGKAGYVVAPCLHDQVCPKLEFNIPCTFSVTYKNLMLHKDYEQGSKSQEENYTYVVLKKGQRSAEQGKTYPRLTEKTQRSSHVHCQLCCPDGTLRNYVVTKTKPSVHLLRCAKKSSPGDLLPIAWPPADSTSESADSASETESDIEEAGRTCYD